MTTLIDEEVKCAVCGKKSIQMFIGSTNSFGSPDLDTRPPEMKRSTIDHWIQRCPSCGYASPNLSKSEADAAKIVASDEYQKIIADTQMPQVAASFLALSYENEKKDRFADAAWEAIHAAWICDDANAREASISCRKKAISLISQAGLHSQIFMDQAGAPEAITLDLMRRAGMFQEALKLIDTIKTDHFEEVVVQIIEYLKKLIENEDTFTHTISEALGEE